MRKKTIKMAVVALAGVAMLSFSTAVKVETFKARVDKSELIWTARKVGGEHTGTVQLKSGTFKVEEGLITTGNFIIDMTTILITDTESQKLHNHLRSKDFFNVDNYKESVLTITGSTKEEDYLLVTGNLTIVGITHPITFKATNIAKTDNFSIYSATIVVDRTKYGIVYRSSAVGDTFIRDEFDLKVKITGEKVQAP